MGRSEERQMTPSGAGGEFQTHEISRAGPQAGLPLQLYRVQTVGSTLTEVVGQGVSVHLAFGLCFKNWLHQKVSSCACCTSVDWRNSRKAAFGHCVYCTSYVVLQCDPHFNCCREALRPTLLVKFQLNCLTAGCSPKAIHARPSTPVAARQ